MKAHPALFEEEEGEGAMKVRNSLYILTHLISQKRCEIERKCQWKLDRKSCMGFRMMEIFLTSGDL